MQNNSVQGARRGLLLTLFILAVVTGLVLVPSQFRQEAGTGQGLFTRTVSHEDGLDNFDIRESKTEEATAVLESFRATAGRNAAVVADFRDGFVRGEETLRTRIPTLAIEYNSDLRAPEMILSDVKKGRGFLTEPANVAGRKHAGILKGFLKQNNDLVGVSDAEIDGLRVFADYTNPDGNLSFVELEQEINGIPVFRGSVEAGFTRNGEMYQVLNNLAPGLDGASLSTDFRNPDDALRIAAKNVDVDLETLDTRRNDTMSSDLRIVYGKGESVNTAEKMYFPTEPGIARATWRVAIHKEVAAYYIMVDAETGTVLWRKNLVNDQTQAATYNVYRNTTSMIGAPDSPAPITPGPLDPTLGTQGVQIGRSDVTLIGNEAPNTFNNLGWVTDGANGVNGHTDGNAVEAGLDIVSPDAIDGPQAGTNRVFSFAYNPPPGMPAPPLPITDPLSRSGAVVQLFYLCNRYHDIMYELGFTEPSRNFQHDNFGRGGAAGDRVRCEAQDFSGTNNANFLTQADGIRGRMQMYRFLNSPDNRDGTIDADVVIHEFTHGLSNRLIGNAVGLQNNRGGGMGEGWSDFYGTSLLSEPTDPINGIYTTGAYATFNVSAFGITTNNSYYGIRRMPYAVLAFTGGAMNRPHNPRTAADVNTGCNLSDGAFPPLFVGTCSQVHNTGEIWVSLLMEVRARMINRLGHATGNRKMLQLVTDGMKLTPNSPNFQTARNAILAAAQASAAAPEASIDVADVWEGFRLRGLGFSGTDSGTTVVEGFDSPNAIVSDPITISDAAGDNDGFPEPGETLSISIPISNNSGGPANNVTAAITGGGNANYGDIADGATVTRQMSYTVPGGAACGSLHQITITGSSSIGALNPKTFGFRLGKPNGGANGASITVPDSGASPPYPSTVNVSGVSGTVAARVRLYGLSHTFPDDLDILLVGPGGQKMIIMSDVGTTNDLVNVDLAFEDAAAANMPDSGVITAGSWKPTNVDTTTDVMPAPAPAAPYQNPAPAGAATFASVFGTDGAAMNGTWSLYVRDDAAQDAGSIIGGWGIFFGTPEYTCTLAPTADRARADFDGDGRSDVSVYRPSEGTWYMNRSTDGFGAVKWGISGDTLTPGDFDNDNKTDFAIFRPQADQSQVDFWILNSNGFVVTAHSWGLSGDIPVIGDWDDDGRSDVVVFRPSENVWYVLRSTGGFLVSPYGQAGDVPVAGDFDGDGIADRTVYRAGTWHSALSGGGLPLAVPLGTAGDILVPADYDDDNKDDHAVFRPSTGQWLIRQSTTSTLVTTFWGSSGDVPVPGDYDGDGRDDLAIYRNGAWWINRSTAGIIVQSFGLGSDLAVPEAYLP